MTGKPITAVHVAYDVVHIKYTKHELYLWELVLLKDLQTAQVIHMETTGGFLVNGKSVEGITSI